MCVLDYIDNIPYKEVTTIYIEFLMFSLFFNSIYLNK
jgi:hypothetical protein